uniref:peptidoglycan glycosyltransferase n=1 Tax=freshwater metagenome TaxID=449393 RepID=A0A6J5YY96_9ZZZZ
MGGAAAFMGLLGGFGYLASVASSAPKLNQLKPAEQGSTSAVYAADGTRLGFIQGDVLRTPAPESEMPQQMRDATVAIEDRRFYKHNGVDYEGVVRAAVKNVSSGATVQGGSTLTMQLVRNLYKGNKERTINRKIREAKLATDLESKHPGAKGKRWILTEYLNNVPYGTVGGQTAVGVSSAARVFFDKPASKLTLSESALLAGLPQAPSQYNPFLAPDLARARRSQVLDQMADQGYITDAQAAAAKKSPLGVKHNSYYAQRREGYFFDYVRSELVKRYGVERVRAGGMKVYTTVDLKLQQAARNAISNHLGYPGAPSSAVVSIDPKSGYIKAMASSGDYSQSKFNLAAQGKRQPGSTFKVMVMMAALRQGVDINETTYESKPLKFTDKKTGVPIDVQTDDHAYSGSTTIFDALVRSDNTVFQQLDLDIGPEEVRQTAYDMGITSKLDAYPAEGLGGLTRGVSPLEMTRAYVTVNNGGWRIKPVAIKKVVFADGREDKSLGQRDRVKVFTDGQTHEAVKAMEANVQGGTGTGAQLGCPTAGKTGTTSNFTDAWFDGFTSSLNTAVWVGFPNAAISTGMFGGQAPASIFHDFMQVAMSGRACDPFPDPTEPFVAKEFAGEYASNGAPGDAVDPLAKDKKDKGKKESKKYESKPNKPPTPSPTPKPTPEPTPEPPPDTGGGGGGATPG